MRKGLAVLLLIVAANLAIWWAMNRPHSDVAWQGQIHSVSFSPYQKDDNPLKGLYPTAEEIDRDLALLAGKVGTVRTYTALEGFDSIPPLAAKHGLKVTVGAYLRGVPAEELANATGDAKAQLEGQQLKWLATNEAELTGLISMARNNPNVDRIIIGNESVLTKQITVPQLIRYIRRVKSQVSQPVSTAEPWHVWLAYPELAREVDFLTVHLLPYWENLSIDDSLEFVLDRYEATKEAFPGKHIYVGEVGWPSAGKARDFAEPSLINQASFLRRFLNVAAVEGIDYNVVEAFDQPWKEDLGAGSVEKYWGLFDSDRNQKFSWIDPVLEFKDWPFQAIASAILAIPMLIFLVLRWDHLRTGGKIFFAILMQFSVSLVIWTMSVPIIKDFAPTTELMFSVMLPLQIMLLGVVLISGFELTELTWAKDRRRRFLPFTPDKAKRFPKVSLHLPICNEPAEMVKITLDSLAKLDWPNLEVIVIDNNTKDPAVWQPVKDYCEKLGSDRFRFFSLGKWPGFKSGALNFALRHTAPDAEVIGVIDADYVVEKDWLRALVPYFDDPTVGWVQAPQDHREWEDDLFKEFINWEYAGFFHIGMVTRNEANAIIQHGTMTLIRKEAIAKHGGWAEWCICEDAELGLRFLNDSYNSVYVNYSFGHGLVPDSFQAYKKQRFRWAFGACQILKGHWRMLMPFMKSNLTGAQKYYFITGWLPWFADAFYLIFTVLSLFWTVGLVVDKGCEATWLQSLAANHSWFAALYDGISLRSLTDPVCKEGPRFDFPLAMFVLPTVGVFVAKVVHHLFLYTTLIKCSWRQRFGSALAGMGLTYAIALAMIQGVFKKSTPFLRTPKAADKAALSAAWEMARDETVLMVSQWIAALVVLWSYGTWDPDARLWALVLFVQSLPYAAALATSFISVLPSKQKADAEPEPEPAPAPPKKEKQAA